MERNNRRARVSTPDGCSSDHEPECSYDSVDGHHLPSSSSSKRPRKSAGMDVDSSAHYIDNDGYIILDDGRKLLGNDGTLDPSDSPDSSSDGVRHDNGSYKNFDAATDDDSDDENKEITRSDIVTFVCLVIITFISWIAYSIMAPYFPNEAHRRGMSDAQIGVLFALHSLVVFFVSPIVGKFIPRIGAKKTLAVGLFLEASANVSFGLSEKLESDAAFMAFTYVTRIVVGLGTATAVTATMTINANTFPKHISRTMGILEMTLGVGLIVGPVIGGALYKLGGSSFLLPFVVVGGVDFASLTIALIVLPKTEHSSATPGSMWELLRIPIIWPFVLACFVSGVTCSYLEPTLSVEATHYVDDAFLIGLLFLLPSGCYAVSSMLWGWIADIYRVERPSIVIGLSVAGLSQFLLGPSPLLHLPKKYMWLFCFSLALAGAGDGGVTVTSISEMFRTATLYGLPEDIRTHGIVSGVFNSAYALGFVIGPSFMGGLLYGRLGFATTTSILGVLNLLIALLIAVLSFLETRWRERVEQSGRKVKHLWRIKTDNYVPETTPLFQQPRIK